jgi:hypothetical protein
MQGEGDFAGNPYLTSVAPNRFAQWGQPTAPSPFPFGLPMAGARAPKGAQGAQPWGAGGAQRPPSRSALGAGCKPQAQRAAHRRMGVGGHGSPPSGGLDMGVFSRGRGREGQRP